MHIKIVKIKTYKLFKFLKSLYNLTVRKKINDFISLLKIISKIWQNLHHVSISEQFLVSNISVWVFFEIAGLNSGHVLGKIDYYNKADELLLNMENLEQQDGIVTASADFWLDSFKNWLNDTQTTLTAKGDNFEHLWFLKS